MVIIRMIWVLVGKFERTPNTPDVIINYPLQLPVLGLRRSLLRDSNRAMDYNVAKRQVQY